MFVDIPIVVIPIPPSIFGRPIKAVFDGARFPFAIAILVSPPTSLPMVCFWFFPTPTMLSILMVSFSVHIRAIFSLPVEQSGCVALGVSAFAVFACVGNSILSVAFLADAVDSPIAFGRLFPDREMVQHGRIGESCHRVCVLLASALGIT